MATSQQNLPSALFKTFGQLLKNQASVLSTRSEAHFTPAGEYKPNKKPADLALASKHAIAKSIRKVKQGEQIEYCPCCNLPTETEYYELSVSISQLAHTGGVGVPLYFQYLKQITFLSVLLFLFVSIYGLVLNLRGHNCSNRENTLTKCDMLALVVPSLGNRDTNDSILVPQIMNLLFVIAMMISILYFRKYQKKIEIACDKNEITPADYTLFAQNFPPATTIGEITNYFKDVAKDIRDVEVTKIVPAYFIGDYIRLLRRKFKLIKMAQKLHAGKKVGGIDQKELDEELTEVYTKITEFEEECATNLESKFAGCVFITFEHEEDARAINQIWNERSIRRYCEEFLSYFTSNSITQGRVFKGRKIALNRAPEPSDVFWENLGYPFKELLKVRGLTSLLTILTLILTMVLLGLIQYGKQYLRTNQQQTHGSVQSQIFVPISGASSVVVVMINGMLGYIVKKLALLEKHVTYTSYYLNIAWRLGIIQFVNTAIIPLVVNEILKVVYFELPLWAEGGLVSNMTTIIFVDAFVTPLIRLFDPLYFLDKYRKSRMLSGKSQFRGDQKAAHKFFEGPEFDIAANYGSLIQCVLTMLFYVTLIPLAVVFCFLGFILTYYIDKYLLLRRHTRPLTLGNELSTIMTDFLGPGMFVFGLGAMTTDYLYYDGLKKINLGTLIIAALLWIIPDDFLNNIVMSKELKEEAKSANKLPFDEARIKFLEEYDRANPITRHEATREWYEYLISKEDNEEVQKLLKNQMAALGDKSPVPGGPEVVDMPAAQETEPEPIKSVFGMNNLINLQLISNLSDNPAIEPIGADKEVDATQRSGARDGSYLSGRGSRKGSSKKQSRMLLNLNFLAKQGLEADDEHENEHEKGQARINPLLNIANNAPLGVLAFGLANHTNDLDLESSPIKMDPINEYNAQPQPKALPSGLQNLFGVQLMQFGALDVLHTKEVQEEQELKKEKMQFEKSLEEMYRNKAQETIAKKRSWKKDQELQPTTPIISPERMPLKVKGGRISVSKPAEKSTASRKTLSNASSQPSELVFQGNALSSIKITAKPNETKTTPLITLENDGKATQGEEKPANNIIGTSFATALITGIPQSKNDLQLELPTGNLKEQSDEGPLSTGKTGNNKELNSPQHFFHEEITNSNSIPSLTDLRGNKSKPESHPPKKSELLEKQMERLKASKSQKKGAPRNFNNLSLGVSKIKK